jgi:hypothetical protein
MSNSTLYDDDILLWSAATIRELGRTRGDLPNALDVENVAEEIETVGRPELAAVNSCLERILVHLIKLFAEPGTQSARHWRSDIVGFPSMRCSDTPRPCVSASISMHFGARRASR